MSKTVEQIRDELWSICDNGCLPLDIDRFAKLLVEIQTPAPVLDENSLLVIHFPQGHSCMANGDERANGAIAEDIAKMVRSKNSTLALPGPIVLQDGTRLGDGWKIEVIQRKPGYGIEVKENG